ncbi:TerB family tellurite resistance protein [Mangrovivirga cuniculi]|uniref:Co-chaperone DjlA N-terminal domain-containing protein n=1 Tax=Mangrovivirga cuniculi TaxID=2715131 RepID=A0A4D7JHG1_9BACT|nr:TerB family tellurite resistance protein [Mangrovivirga cuniculi]QCK15051.1 hypothetical protein DCC35_09980 [Mangrovivirga cuniculi]
MVGFFETEHLKFKKDYMSNLIALAHADGHLHDKELAFIINAAKRLNLKDKHLKELLDDADNLKIKVPASMNSKLDLLHDLTIVILADGRVDENEIEFCRHVADLMGLKETFVIDLVYKFQSGHPNLTQWEEIKEQYLNDKSILDPSLNT